MACFAFAQTIETAGSAACALASSKTKKDTR
jgi:hypothetical protein